jgi:hypothetical protein
MSRPPLAMRAHCTPGQQGQKKMLHPVSVFEQPAPLLS